MGSRSERRSRHAGASPRIVATLLFLLLASPAIGAPLTISAPPGVTTIKAIDVEAEAVRLRLVVTLTRTVSYRIAQPRPDRLVIDIERANFDLSHPVDLDAQGGWVVDWSYGYLMLGFTRLSLTFDRGVVVLRDTISAETGSRPAKLSIDLAEAP